MGKLVSGWRERFSKMTSGYTKFSIQSKPLYNIIERFAKISILPLFFAFLYKSDDRFKPSLS